MSVIIILIAVSLIVGLIFLGAFIWSVRSGQYEDTLTPAMRVLLDDAPTQNYSVNAGGKTTPLPQTKSNPGVGPNTKNP